MASPLLLLLVISACYSPHEPDCGFFCGPDGACPAKYHCAGDGRCHRDGTPESLICPPDATITAPDSADLTPPHVVMTSPVDGATGVALDAAITITFDEPVLGVDATTFSAGQPGTVAEMSPTVFVLTSNTDWTAGSVITVQLTGGIHDASGNALAATTFSFTTTP